MQEVWKDIKGFEGMYQISNLGNARGLCRTVVRSDGVEITIMGKNLTKSINNYGYVVYSLSKQHREHKLLANRLVAEAFIPNPDGKSEVNHLDEVKTNNCVWNLEWATHYENSTYGTTISRMMATTTKNREQGTYVSGRTSIPIVQFDLSGNQIKVWESGAKGAGKALNIHPNDITACLKHKQKTSGKFRWAYQSKAI